MPASDFQPQLSHKGYTVTMTDLSAFPITKKWPAEHPDRIQLY